MRRFHTPFLVLFVFGFGTAGSARAAPECVSFDRLVPAFADELAIDVKTAKINFIPINLAWNLKGAERPGYVVSDESSCSIRGDCDSLVYLGDARGCYRAVLGFRGKWKGLTRKQGRELASIKIESRFEGDAVKNKAILRIERRERWFEFDPTKDVYEERK
jgi:hypothetical protein